VQELRLSVFRYLVAMVGDADVAEDLTQDVYERAYLHLDQLRNPTAARAWLFGIAANAARMHHRRGRRLRWLPLEALGGHAHTRDENDVGELEVALARLRSEERSALVLIGYLGFTAAEAAEAMGCSPEAARKRWQRACARFRALHPREEP
jgi:RNA polymerase sigma-70 factor (ECF subfamily)